MNVIVEDSANIAMDNIYYYNLKYSLKNALETDNNIRLKINNWSISLIQVGIFLK